MRIGSYTSSQTAEISLSCPFWCSRTSCPEYRDPDGRTEKGRAVACILHTKLVNICVSPIDMDSIQIPIEVARVVLQGYKDVDGTEGELMLFSYTPR